MSTAAGCARAMLVRTASRTTAEDGEAEPMAKPTSACLIDAAADPAGPRPQAGLDIRPRPSRREARKETGA